MPVAATVLLTFVLLALACLVAWVWQRRSRNAGMIDPIWAGATGAVSVPIALLANGAPLARSLVALGGLAWGLRLGVHLWRRNFGKPEDWRYRAMRDNWGVAADRKFFWLFQLQAAVSVLLAVAYLVPAYRVSPPSGWAVALFVLIWCVAVFGEAMADRSLRRFAANPANRGQVCRDGLWRYSRHPNYFFECVHWVAYVPLGIGSPWGWALLLPPCLMAWLLLKISGVPLLEARSLRERSGYAEYQRTTSVLIPWPPSRVREGVQS